MAMHLLWDGHYERSVAAYRELSASEPDFLWRLAGLGEALMRSGQHPLAASNPGAVSGRIGTP